MRSPISSARQGLDHAAAAPAVSPDAELETTNDDETKR
jgi:hypothetical protein